ncbi:MAG TPA: hypothetical protein VLL54_11365 [Pyrinomonadaceae bacterium]|nr:hypothetical protein [Pyrinomonadaceae bacterium]
MPWWQAEIPTIKNEHLKYVRRHLPALREDHDDLIGDTLLALTNHLNRYSDRLPTSWFRSSAPAKKAEREHLHRLAKVILKRRIADLFRKRASPKWYLPAAEPEEDVADPRVVLPDRQIMVRRLLEATSALLDEMPPEDRDFVELVFSEPGFHRALNPGERKRLQRVREKIKARIIEQLGDNVTELLRKTL